MNSSPVRRVLVAGFVALFAFAAWARADDAPTADRTKADIAALLQEFLSRVDDPAMHARFWADDLVYTSGKAEVKSKADILRSMANAPKASTPPAPTTYAAEDVSIRAYGTTAALTFRLVAHNPDGTTAHYRNSGTFLFRDGQWQVVTWQATREPAAN